MAFGKKKKDDEGKLAEKSAAPKPTESKPTPAPKKPPEKKASPKITKDDAFLQELAKHPLGSDGRTLAFACAETNVSKAFGRLNELVAAGYARKVGGVYQPTPAGTVFAAGQKIEPAPKK